VPGPRKFTSWVSGLSVLPWEKSRSCPDRPESGRHKPTLRPSISPELKKSPTFDQNSLPSPAAASPSIAVQGPGRSAALVPGRRDGCGQRNIRVRPGFVCRGAEPHPNFATHKHGLLLQRRERVQGRPRSPSSSDRRRTRLKARTTQPHPAASPGTPLWVWTDLCTPSTQCARQTRQPCTGEFDKFADPLDARDALNSTAPFHRDPRIGRPPPHGMYCSVGRANGGIVRAKHGARRLTQPVWRGRSTWQFLVGFGRGPPSAVPPPGAPARSTG